jgi:hypothetical protein
MKKKNEDEILYENFEELKATNSIMFNYIKYLKVIY